MYYVTTRHGATLPKEIAALWDKLAEPRDNVPPMLHFLLEIGMEAAQQVGGRGGAIETELADRGARGRGRGRSTAGRRDRGGRERPRCSRPAQSNYSGL